MLRLCISNKFPGEVGAHRKKPWAEADKAVSALASPLVSTWAVAAFLGAWSTWSKNAHPEKPKRKKKKAKKTVCHLQGVHAGSDLDKEMT